MRRNQIKKSNYFPRINRTNHSVESDQTPIYNCIAFAAGDLSRNWWPVHGPDGYWPVGVPRSDSIQFFVQAFQTLGYEVCGDGSFEESVEKIVLYGFGGAIKHAAKQMGENKWASKLGRAEDIYHRIDAVAGGNYGETLIFMCRPINQQ